MIGIFLHKVARNTSSHFTLAQLAAVQLTDANQAKPVVSLAWCGVCYGQTSETSGDSFVQFLADSRLLSTIGGTIVGTFYPLFQIWETLNMLSCWVNSTVHRASLFEL